MIGRQGGMDGGTDRGGRTRERTRRGGALQVECMRGNDKIGGRGSQREDWD